GRHTNVTRLSSPATARQTTTAPILASLASASAARNAPLCLPFLLPPP
uniref:Uncharacterized protein n=1 Tax=Steinernema glaseri TaxID=37863 RepID=A0A1I8AC09_9BILA